MNDNPGLGPAAAGPGPDPESAPTPGPPDRTEGLRLETCYRHPDVATGVHCTRCGRPICPDCMHPAAVGYQCPDCLKEAAHSMPRTRRTLTVGGMGPVTRILILANVGMFLVEVVRGGPGSLVWGPDRDSLIHLGAMYPPNIAAGQYWRLFTVMFLHAGIIHLAMNMYALYLFGPLLEEAYGPVRYLALYLISGFFGAAVSFALGPILIPGVGASGAIFGLFGAWFAYNYRRREVRFHRAQLQGAATLIIINMVFSLALSRYIDWRAHLGGLIAGVMLGLTAEGIGTGVIRRAVQLGGFVLVLAVAVAIAVSRANYLQSLVERFVV